MLIPKDETVRFVLKEILQKRAIRSQAELAEALSERLRQVDVQYAVSAQRARAIAMETPGIRVRIAIRKGKPPKKCPACGGKLDRTYTRNLKGKKILLRMKCLRCSYRGAGNKWIPGRYGFESGGPT
jgi:hypothetical protein